jgi:hypothetical protein
MTQEEYKNLGLPSDKDIEQKCKDMTPIEAAEWMRDVAADAAYGTRYDILEVVAKAKISADRMYGRAGYDMGDFYDFVMELAAEIERLAEI